MCTCCLEGAHEYYVHFLSAWKKLCVLSKIKGKGTSSVSCFRVLYPNRVSGVQRILVKSC